MNPDQLTADISDAERARFAAVGQLTKQFRPSVSNAIAGLILGAGCLGGGVFAIYTATRALIRAGWDLPFWQEKGWSLGAVGLAAVLGIVVIGVGVFLIWVARDIAERTIYLCEHGFWYSARSKVRVFPWKEIASIKETVMHEKLPLVKGPARALMPTKTSSSYLVRRADGETFNLTASDTSGFGELAGMLKHKAEEMQIPWEIIETRG